MPNHPLLVFPVPYHTKRTNRPGFGSRLRLPAATQQGQRLAPQFQQPQRAMEQRRASLQNNSLGIQPEQVLVLETVGSIENFINAVRRVEGLEWLGEFERGDIIPDFGFEDESNPERSLREQMFLLMTNQQALREMRSLFNIWREAPDTKFPYGLAKLRDAFRYLQDIRPWSADDRIRETGLLEDWQFRLQNDESTVPFEAELWFWNDIALRDKSESYVRRVVASLGGEVIQQSVIPDINYHGVLGTIPRARVQEMVDQPGVQVNIALFQCDGIMYIRPVGQCAIEIPGDALAGNALEEALPKEPPTKQPLVALLDGLPLAGHQHIDRRLIIDDPDSYESSYQASQRVHGTAMSSLICLGDIHEGGRPIERQLYVRPIMQPRIRFNGSFYEAIPPRCTADRPGSPSCTETV